MNYKQWTRWTVIIILVSPIIIATVNYTIDPFGIFGHKPDNCFQPNERFVKIELLNRKKEDFQGYLIGSSRIGTTEPSTIEQYKKGQKFYNMTMSAGTLAEFEQIVRYMINQNYPLKTLYLQVDVYDNLLGDYSDPNILLLRMHPFVLNQEKGAFYKSYLLGFSFDDLFRQFQINIGMSTNPRKYDFFQTGCWYDMEKEKMLIKDPKNYVTHEKSFHRTVDKELVTNSQAIKQNVKALKNLVALCEYYKIELHVFVTPHNHNMMKEISFQDYISFLSALSDITNYWDFSGYNSITVNDENYYEYSHYRPHVSALIAGRIFNDSNLSIPSDFGILVTKATLQKHLLDLKTQREYYEKKDNHDSAQAD